MREMHRMKEKHELSLDTRQIVSLSIAGVVVIGAVFVLGVMVGQKMAADQQPAEKAPDLLSALDQRAANLESLQAQDASLTFQDELTRKTPVVIAEASKLPEPVKPPEAVKPPEPVKPAPSPSNGVADAPKPAPSPSNETVEPEPVKVPEIKVAEAPKAEAIPVRTNDAGALKDAIARVTAKPAEATADGAWTLQLSAYQDKAEADRFASGLRDRGYAPYIVEAEVSGKGTWFRVRMGRFASRDAAGRYLSDFKRETSLEAFVTNGK